MQGLRFLLAAALGTLAIAPGCSGEVVQQPYLDVQSFAEQVASEACRGAASCCDQAGYPRRATCDAYRDSLLAQFAELETLQVHYDGRAAVDCVAATAEFISECRPNVQAPLLQCAPVFVGLVPPGGPCQKSAECANDGGCNTKVHQCARTLHLGPGDACNENCRGFPCSVSVGSDDVLSEGYCFRSDGLFCGASETCEPLAAAGDSCTSEKGCAPGSYCSNEASRCALLLNDDDSCTKSSQCKSGYCRDDVEPMKCATYASSRYCEVPGE